MLLLCCLARAWEGYREETNIKESYKTFEVTSMGDMTKKDEGV